MTKIGLTVGKYAPFHKGHQYLIETALNEMDSLIIIVYDAPKHTDIPLNIRANWIRKLYPQVTVIEGWEIPKEEGWSEENQRKHEDFIKSFIKDISITAFYSSENYGERMSQSLGCQNRIVDMERNAIHISATDIRKDAYGFKTFLDPIVYSDYITKIYLFGHDKTELSLALANVYQTTSVVDVEKEYRTIQGKYETLSDSEYTELASIHIQEFKVKNYEAHRYLFVDSDLIALQVSYKNTHHKNNPTIDSLIAQNLSNYDLLFISQDEGYVSNELHLMTELNTLKIPYRILTGSLESKLLQIQHILKTFQKFFSTNY